MPCLCLLETRSSCSMQHAMKFFMPHCMRRALLLAAQDPNSGVVHQLSWLFDCRALLGGADVLASLT